MNIDDNCKELLLLFLDSQYKIKKSENLDDEVEIRKMIAIKILSSLILSKKLFKRNSDLGVFLEEYFDIKLSKSMLSSRTVICGKVIREIELLEEDDLNVVLDQLYNVLNKVSKEENFEDKNIYDVIKKMEMQYGLNY